ncbi:MAG: glycosyltransferase, partial [Opitutaceae bacterium]|nr:glycosyltransferase [Opitutaceae bacterium]
MRKLIILQDYLRNGGTERQSIHLARALAESGCDVTLLTFRPGGALAPQSGVSTGQQRPTANFKCRSLQPIDTRLDFFAPRLHATIRRLAPQIVLCMGRMANCKAGRIARAFPRVAVISTMRTGKPLPAAYARSLHATRHTIANSHEAARILRETYSVPAGKITVIHNALLMDMPQATVPQVVSPCDGAKTPPDSRSTGFQPVGSSSMGVPPMSLRSEGVPPVISSSEGVPPASPGESNTAASPPVRLLCSAMFRPEKNHRELLELFSRLPAASTAFTAPAVPTVPAVLAAPS